MSAVSLGESHARPCTGRERMRCSSSAGADHVVVIDVESDTFTNLIYIDVPESVPKKFGGNTAPKKRKRRFSRNVIFIDDDESNENEHPDLDEQYFFHDPSPSMRSCSTSKNATNHSDDIGDDCQFVRENIPPVTLSKCKRTYSGKAPVRNRYGLATDSESSSSDSDEFMEDGSGQLQKQWERASLKRNNSGQSGFGDLNNTARVGKQPEPGEHQEQPTFSGHAKSTNEEEDLSPESTPVSRCTSDMADANGIRDPHVNDPLFHVPEQLNSQNFKEGCSSLPRVDQQNLFQKQHSEQCNGGNTSAAEPCLQKPVSRGDNNFSYRRYILVEEEPSLAKQQHVVETEDGRSQHISAEDGRSQHISAEDGRSQHEDEGNDQMNAQDGDNVQGIAEHCITTERERIKETPEFKKIQEEEFAKRKIAVEMQAESARKRKLLLRRKRAESMRLLDMEKRQKQRVEEMRETQKKDEENRNLKERIRAEVRNELTKLEMACHDMGSVLYALEIPLRGTSPHEVRLAYKKAIMAFHPDKFSRSDIRQQVEAEEKFKLITRMKDKYLPTL